MKKLILSALFVLLLQTPGTAQIPVIDKAQNKIDEKSWATQLGSATSQVVSLIESANHLLQSIEFYQKVSGVIKNAQTLYNVLDTQVKLITYASEAMTLPTNKIGSYKVYDRYRQKILTIIEKNEANTKILKDFITQGIFNMTDAERLEAIDRIEEKTNLLYREIYDAQFTFNSTNNRLLAIKALKN